jgi:putative cell wall-binding protein
LTKAVLAVFVTLGFAVTPLIATPVIAATPLTTPPVSGTLSWASDALPVVGGLVTVSLECNRQLTVVSATTAADGAYSIPAGYVAEPCQDASRPIVISAVGAVGAKSIRQTVTVTSTLELVRDFSLVRRFEASGRVTDAVDGAPIAGALVEAWRYCPDGCSEPSPGGEARTDADGRYTVLVPPGPWYLLVHAPKASQMSAESPEFDAVDNGSGAYDIITDRLPVITGIVTTSDSPPAPLGGVKVGNTTTDVNGHYSFSVDESYSDPFPREYSFDVADPIGEYSGVRKSLVIDKSTVTTLDFVLERAASVSGTITGPIGDSGASGPLADVEVTLSGTGPNNGLKATTDASGEYVLPHLASGSYQVTFAGDGFATEVWNDIPRDQPGTPVVVRPGEPVSRVDAVLEAPSTVSGEVRLSEGSASLLRGTVVTLTPVANSIGYTYRIAESSPADFTFGDIHPGDYTLTYVPGNSAYRTVYSGGVIDPTKAEVISITAGSTIELPAITLPKVTGPANTSRISGADRFAVAIEVSRQAYPSGSNTVYVVTGENYPDALSAGPAAISDDAPLLLTQTSTLPSAVAAEIRRLHVKKIVVVGGPNSVSEAVFTQLKTLAADTVRVSGADRYEASRNVAEYAFGESGSELAYVATGANFPDALSAGAAAGSADAPVILVNGSTASVDTPTHSLLSGLGVTSIAVAGGPNSVSTGMEASLNEIAPTKRLSGADRFAASAAINADAFAYSSEAFLVTGMKFPDALSGSAWAGSVGAPLYVAQQDCVPKVALDAMTKQGVDHVTLIGGPASLSQNVALLRTC